MQCTNFMIFFHQISVSQQIEYVCFQTVNVERFTAASFWSFHLQPTALDIFSLLLSRFYEKACFCFFLCLHGVDNISIKKKSLKFQRFVNILVQYQILYGTFFLLHWIIHLLGLRKSVFNHFCGLNNNSTLDAMINPILGIILG